MKTLPFSRHLLAAAMVAAFAATPALAEKHHNPRHDAPPPHNNAHRPPAPPPQQHNNANRPPATPPAAHNNANTRRAAPPPKPAPAPARRDVRETIRTTPAPASPRFSAHDRQVVRNYYQPRMKRGECPPGMHFERGHCYRNAPRPWVIGQPLPPTVIIEAPPPAVVQVLPPPPPQYRYASVAGDILLLAIGTNMVIDALDNLFD